MADVNEEILVEYLKLVKKWLYVSDISFPVPGNYSNIDILAFDPKNNKYFDFEVKFRSRGSLANNGEDILYFVSQFLTYKKERDKKIQEFIGRKKATNDMPLNQ